MALDIKYLARLLANGVSQAQSAAAVGCTPSYISQLLSSNHELQEAIMTEEARLALQSISRTESLTTIEADLLNRVADLVPYSDSLGEATAALQKISDMRERRELSSKGGNSGRPNNVIELNLGKIAHSKLEVSMGDNRVIMNIGGMSMARAPSTKVKELIANRLTHDNSAPEEDDEDIWDIPDATAGRM